MNGLYSRITTIRNHATRLWDKKIMLIKKGQIKKTAGKKIAQEEKDFFKKINNDQAAGDLIHALQRSNPAIARFLVRSFQGLPCSPTSEERAYDFFLTSPFIVAATASRGSSVFTEFLYRAKAVNIIDEYCLKCGAGNGIRSRLDVIQKKLPEIINELLLKKDNLLIGNLGSGPGRDVTNVLSRYYRNSDKIRVINIDTDTAALKRGARIAESKNISHLVEFKTGNFMKFEPERKFDLILLVGVLCPLNAETCIKVLQRIRHLLSDDGYIVASNATKAMEALDPFGYYIMNWIANWYLVFKDEPDLKAIFEESGYRWKASFSDKYGCNIMGIGTPLS